MMFAVRAVHPPCPLRKGEVQMGRRFAFVANNDMKLKGIA